MKTLEKINKKLQKQYKANRATAAATWFGLQYGLGHITKEQYKLAFKNIKKYIKGGR